MRQDGTAACMLTWLYFFNDKTNNIKAEDYELAPKFVRLAHDYDVWRYQYGEETEFFNLGWQAYGITSPLDTRLSDLFDEKHLDKLLSIGKACKAFRDNNGIIACNEYGFEVELEGKKGFALNNCIRGGSTWFRGIINKYDFVCAFLYMGKDKQWEYSFYSNATNGCDCAKLAQSINPKGGGHEHAAGCTLDKFIFDK